MINCTKKILSTYVITTMLICQATLPNSLTTVKEKASNLVARTAQKKQASEESLSLKLLGNAKKKYSKNAYPHAQETAQVRDDAALAPEEIAFRTKRLKAVQEAMTKAFGATIPDQAVPIIAICGSGGGYRAMISTTGSIKAADQTGLLGMVTYLAGVSGSTWAISGFMNSGLTADNYLKQLYKRLEKPLTQNVDVGFLSEAMLRKTAFDQPLTMIDIYGNLVAQKIIKGLSGKNNPNDVPLDACSPLVHQGKLPMPLYTAVIANEDTYQWVEFTPYEVGSSYLKTHIPTWAFGRKFDKGVSTDPAPTQSLSFGMGIWGSAMTANVGEILQDFKKNKAGNMQAIMQMFLDASSTEGLLKERISPAKVFNWNFGTSHPLASTEHLILVDAGLAINIPTPPFLGPDRPVDIMIILDNGKTLGDGSQLKHTETYAKEHNLKFPPIDYTKTGLPFSVHMDPQDINCPVVIYLPMVTNADYEKGWNPSPLLPDAFTKTENFAYTPDQVKKLSGLTAFTMRQATTQQAIRDAIMLKINQKVPNTIKIEPAKDIKKESQPAEQKQTTDQPTIQSTAAK